MTRVSKSLDDLVADVLDAAGVVNVQWDLDGQDYLVPDSGLSQALTNMRMALESLHAHERCALCGLHRSSHPNREVCPHGFERTVST